MLKRSYCIGRYTSDARTVEILMAETGYAVAKFSLAEAKEHIKNHVLNTGNSPHVLLFKEVPFKVEAVVSIEGEETE